MQMSGYPGRTSFGLLPEPEGRSAPFVTSATVNVIILGLVIYIGMTAKHAMQEHKFEQTELIFPTTPPPQPKFKTPPPPKLPEPPKPKLEMQMEQPKINMPKTEPKPALKPMEMEAKLNTPQIKAAKPAIILAPQPKAALTAAMPAQTNTVKASTAPVHLGETFGVTPNPECNPAGDGSRDRQSLWRHAGAGSRSTWSGGIDRNRQWTEVRFECRRSRQGGAGRNPRWNGNRNDGLCTGGKVASAEFRRRWQPCPPWQQTPREVAPTNLEVLSKPAVQYTPEARQLRVQGDVILRVTFTASGQVVIKGVVHGLGHGLDEEARRVASQIRFRPATRNGQAVDLTTNITITFQLA